MKIVKKTFKPLPLIEFVILFTLLTALTALSIDIMLPALPNIKAGFLIKEEKLLQLIISMLFFGMVFGEMVFGALSDAIGRKITILIGIGFFIVGTIIAYQASSYAWLLFGRVVQGFGAAAPKISSRALIRDQYRGEAMARIMSFIMMTLIVVPMLAPAFGQLILLVADWREIFLMLLIVAIITGIWLLFRQGETLIPEKRIPLSIENLYQSIQAICHHKRVMIYTTTLGFVFGVFMVYLSTSQKIFYDLYLVGNRFPLYFAGLALGLGLASMLNGMLVMRLGIERLIYIAIRVYLLASVMLLVVSIVFSGVPPIWLFMAMCFIIFACNSFLFSNLNASALSHLGQVAGIGVAVVSSISTLIAVVIGVVVGWFYNDTLIPLSMAFVVSSIVSMLLTNYARYQSTEDVVIQYKK